jgi:hypothetical protein
MATVEIDPVDGLPAWKGRRKVTELQKRREAKRAQRFVMVSWGYLVPRLSLLKFGRAQRLFFVLLLHRNLTKAKANGGWVELIQHDLVAADLANSNLYKAVTKLEAFGLVEVKRRRGRRPLLRLVGTSET